MDGSYTGVLHVEVFAVKLQMQMDPGWSQAVFCAEDLTERQLNLDGHVHTYQRDTGHTHELAPQCARTHSWAECWHGECLCGLPTERPRWDIPAAVLSHSKRMTGWLSKLLSGICLIWALCLHLPSAPLLKAAALPLFASLCLSFRQWGEWQ